MTALHIVEPRVEIVGDAKALLGESVSYAAASDSVYWIDIPGRKLFLTALGSGKTHSFAFEREPGFVQPCTDGKILIGQGCSILVFDPATSRSEAFAEVGTGDPTMRTNDAACNQSGQLVIGTMRPGPTRSPDPVGGLHLVGRDTVADVRSGLAIPNGLAFDAAGRMLYWADTPKRCIWRGALAAGGLTSVELFAELPQGSGRPDGAAVDAAGCYWVAAVWGWSLLRYTPAGALDLVVRLPVQRPTKLAFGGSARRTILVTSASVDLDNPQSQPLAGHLIAFDIGIEGLAAAEFRR